jgi:hypothetical protein
MKKKTANISFPNEKHALNSAHCVCDTDIAGVSNEVGAELAVVEVPDLPKQRSRTDNQHRAPNARNHAPRSRLRAHLDELIPSSRDNQRGVQVRREANTRDPLLKNEDTEEPSELSATREEADFAVLCQCPTDLVSIIGDGVLELSEGVPDELGSGKRVSSFTDSYGANGIDSAATAPRRANGLSWVRYLRESGLEPSPPRAVLTTG